MYVIIRMGFTPTQYLIPDECGSIRINLGGQRCVDQRSQRYRWSEHASRAAILTIEDARRVVEVLGAPACMYERSDSPRVLAERRKYAAYDHALEGVHTASFGWRDPRARDRLQKAQDAIWPEG